VRKRVPRGRRAISNATASTDAGEPANDTFLPEQAGQTKPALTTVATPLRAVMGGECRGRGKLLRPQLLLRKPARRVSAARAVSAIC